jgi:hypothetical protein
MMMMYRTAILAVLLALTSGVAHALPLPQAGSEAWALPGLEDICFFRGRPIACKLLGDFCIY